MRDILPAFILAAVASGIAWPICLTGLAGVSLIAAQVVVMLAAYCLIAKLFHVEEFDYLLATVRGMAGRN